MAKYWIQLIDATGTVKRRFTFQNFQMNAPLQRDIYRMKHREGATLFCTCKGDSPDKRIGLSVGKRARTIYLVNGDNNTLSHKRNCPLHKHYVRDFIVKKRTR